MSFDLSALAYSENLLYLGISVYFIITTGGYLSCLP